MTQEVKVMSRDAYQEFIYCPYCGHCHTHFNGQDYWGPIFHGICFRCGKFFLVRLVRLVVRDEGNKVWLVGKGFKSELTHQYDWFRMKVEESTLDFDWNISTADLYGMLPRRRPASFYTWGNDNAYISNTSASFETKPKGNGYFSTEEEDE
jgi:hypothetical protein